MLATLRRHWPEYLMEAAGLGCFMLSACAFATLMEHPASPVRQALPDPLLRRVPMGLAMALTLLAIVYSPWGQQSGAHLNPCMTLTWLRLSKIAPADALGYIAGQFLGGVGGVLVASRLLGGLVAHPAVSYAATVPGEAGAVAAFAAEFGIAGLLMFAVLNVSNTPRLARLTPLCAAALVATYIVVEAPISGMSMNPARTVGSALPPALWRDTWVYFAAPALGMLLASELYLRLRGGRSVVCAKLHHHNARRCIFRCGYAPSPSGRGGEPSLTGSA